MCVCVCVCDGDKVDFDENKKEPTLAVRVAKERRHGLVVQRLTFGVRGMFSQCQFPKSTSDLISTLTYLKSDDLSRHLSLSLSLSF